MQWFSAQCFPDSFFPCWRRAALEGPQGRMWQMFRPCRASNLDLHGHWVTHTWMAAGVTRHRALELRGGGRCSNSGYGWAAWGHSTSAGPEMWEEQRPGGDLLTYACHMAAAHWVFPATLCPGLQPLSQDILQQSQVPSSCPCSALMPELSP